MLLPPVVRKGYRNESWIMDASTARSRRPDAIGKAILWRLLPTLVLFLITPSVGNAEVVTNITSLPTDPGYLGTTITHTGGHLYDIGGGTRPGDGTGPILFHSFRDFSVGQSVGQSDIANFFNDSGLMTTNIIGRVTGGNPSNIDGIIRTTDFPGANLFLINPFGILFGPQGSFDVTGSVSFSTAQYLRLFDSLNGVSANFYADSANDGLENSVLFLPPLVDFGFLSPAAYGFLTAPDPNATITVQGSALSVLPGQSISLVGREVVIQDATLPDADGTIQRAQLSAPNGRIHLASAASPGEFAALPGESLANATTLQAVPNNPEDPASAVSFSSFGTVSLAPGSSIDISGVSTVVFVKDGQLVLLVNDATLNTSESTAQQDTILLSRGSSIVTSNSGADPGTDVQLMASKVQLDGASIQSVTMGAGRGGDISITNAQTVSLNIGAQIVSDTKGVGHGGNITIATTNTPDISSVEISGSDGTGTLIGVMNPIVGIVTSGVFSTASAGGQGGQISITAPNVKLDNEATIETANSGVGTGGGISINSTTVTVGLTIEAFILSLTGLDSTFAPVDSGNGGNVTIHGLSGAANSAAGKVMLSGESQLGSGSLITSIAGGPSSGGNILITSGDVELDAGTSIVSGFAGIGDGGNITVNVGTLSLTNSVIKSLNESVRLGKGGDITVQGLPGAPDNPATLVTLSSGANITSETSAQDPGGAIVITSGTVKLDTGASINSVTSGSGDGGSITANVDRLELMNSSLELMNIASISSKTSSLELGRGGDITVQGLPGATNNAATLVTLTNGSEIATQAFHSGDGGQVTITSKTLTIDNGIISTTTDETGIGGDIVMNVLEARLSGGAKISSVTKRGASSDPDALPAGNGGKVTVQGLDGVVDGVPSKANFFIASDVSGIISTSVGEGRLGDIEVYAKTVTLTDTGLIQVGNQLDTGKFAGNVIIDADSVSISGRSSISSQVKFADAGQVKITADQLTLNDGTIEVSTHGIGNGGDVFLDVGSMSLANGATITSSSFSTDPGAGDAGTVKITSSGSFTSDASTIATSAENAKGGDILIDAQNVRLSNGTLISASSRSPLLPKGAGNAGNITINSDSNVVMQNSKVTTEASDASGGSIEINASDTGMIQLVNSRVSTSVGGLAGESDGGNINIDPQFVILQNSQILAQAVVGAGGAIDIIATSAFIANPVSIVNASSTLGISGTVNIQSPLQNVGEEVTPLSEEFSNAAALLAQQCAARAADGKFSTFVVAAREGLPVEPGGFLASPSWATGTVSGTISAAEMVPDTVSPLHFPAVTGLFQNYDGRPIQLAKLGNTCR